MGWTHGDLSEAIAEGAIFSEQEIHKAPFQGSLILLLSLFLLLLLLLLFSSLASKHELISCVLLSYIYIFSLSC